MRIPTQISAVVGGLAFVVFGALAAWQAANERADLTRAVEEEMLLTGRAMRVATENALRDGQLHDVEATVSALEEIRADVDVLMFGPDGRLRAASEGAPAIQPTTTGGPTGRPFVDVSLDDNRAVLVLPLSNDVKSLGTLLIHRPLDDIRADLRRELSALALAVFGFTFIVTALVYALGVALVGRPLARLSVAMAGVGHGEFHPRLDMRRRDEIGRLTRDFAAMLGELEQARANLEREQDAHRRSTRALQDADRLATIGQLSAGLAHEIGSPLQVLHGRARRLLRVADRPEDVRRTAEVIADQAERITRIVHQLLDVARRRRSHSRGSPAAAVRTVVELLEIEAERIGVSLELELAPALPTQTGDTDYLQQIALNLVRNALQASSEHGRVVVSLASHALATAENSPRSMLRLTVRDQGRGIPADARPLLFEPFFTTRASEGGTGLGLAIVGSLVKELRGTITFTSEPGRGSQFVVELPVADGNGGPA